MPTLTIDGREITVEQGTRVIEAADRLGVPIPRFCYHPGLSVAANCRMCLVESSKWSKLVPACFDFCQEGAVIKTDSGRIRDARASVLEFILLNHPVDCPVCDQAGECDLQDQFFQFSARPSRHFFRKEHKPKARVLGPNVIHDGERCINCTRCVRFCAEVARNPQLQQVNRGGHTYIDVFPGRELDNPYSMCVADLCPVGALTTRDFRFKCRVWFTRGTDTVCAECSRGCAVRVDTFRNAIQRVVPRHNPAVNGHWACDAGRLAYHRYEKDRLESPRAGDATVPYEAAIQDLASVLRPVLNTAGRTAGVILSPFLTCEDAAAVLALFKGHEADCLFAVAGRGPGEGDAILVRPDRNPNRAGLEAVFAAAGVTPVEPARLIEDPGSAFLAALLVFGGEGGDEPLAGALRRVELNAVFSAGETALSGVASHVFPTASPYESEGTFVNEFKVVQKIRPAVTMGKDTRQVFQVAVDLADRLGVTMPARDIAGLSRWI